MSVDVEELTHDRIKQLRKDHRDISFDYVIQDGEKGKWAVIIYAEYNFNPMGFDFIESDSSWMRSEAIDEYNALIDEGYCVVVYLPAESVNDFKNMVKEKGGKPNIRLITIEKGLLM